MSNARIQFSLASEDVWNAYNPQLKEGEIVTVLKANKKVKLVQGKVGNSMYSESTVIWDEDEAQIIMSRSEAAASTSTTQAAAASGSASKAAASQSAAAMSATNAKASENAAKTSETNAKSSETAARNSATSAASSASTASTQAGKAADSATAAAGSATQASTFATTATNQATAAAKSESNAKAYMDTTKDLSENVNVFVPAVDADGTLTWTNKAGLSNPAAVNIKGAKGDKGDTGTAASIMVGTVTTGAAGSSASVVNRGDANNAILDFILPKGADGKGSVITVNGKEPDAGGNVNVANMTGASDSAAGKAGLVPAPAAGMQNKFLCANATWKDAGGLPVGHEFFTTNPNIPAGCIPLLGGEYSRTAYADLWAWVQTQSGYLLEESAWQTRATANGGNVPFYSKGDGTTTFRVPALKCWVKGANSISEIGGYLAAGLPNITGTTKAAYGENNQTTNVGALQTDIYTIGSASGRQDGGNGSDGEPIQSAILTFNASKSNSIYGSSDTVQPSSIVGLWCVKAYGTVTNVGSTDVANISTGLTQAETRISALENHGAGATVVESYRNGTEWYRVWSDGWVEQGGYLTEALMPLTFTITFLKAFADTNYTHVIGATSVGTSTYANGYYSSTTKATTNIGVHVQSAAENFGKNCRVDWYACGQGA